MSWADKIRGGPPPPATTQPEASPAAASKATQQQQHQQEAPRVAAVDHPSQQQQIDFFVVMDFEATCEKDRRIRNQEIIEVPCVVVDANRAVVVGEFQRYVKPQHNAILSGFCKDLTGIPQLCVDEAQPFAAVFGEFRHYLAAACGLTDANAARWLVVTCGDWDLKTMLPTQFGNLSKHDQQKLGHVPECFRRWCNLKKVFERFAKRRIRGMGDMLDAVDLKMVGHHHSGIDDARNIARCLIGLLRRGFAVECTETGGKSQADLVAASRAIKDTCSYPAQCASSLAVLSPNAQAALERQQSASKLAQQQLEIGGGGDAAAAGIDVGDASSAAAAASLSAASSLLGPVVDCDNRRNAADEILGKQDPAAVFADPSAMTKFSRALSTVLRHQALNWRLPMSLNGFVKVQDLLRNNRFHQNTPLHFAAVAKASDKQRFFLGVGARDGELYVRANQGHSIEGLVVDMEPITDAKQCPVAVHGTHTAAWVLIQKTGLSRMGRQHIHFAAGLPDDSGVISGMRKNADIHIYLDVDAFLKAGGLLYRSANNVVLTAGFGETGMIPTAFFSKVVDRRTGKNLIDAGPQQ